MNKPCNYLIRLATIFAILTLSTVWSAEDQQAISVASERRGDSRIRACLLKYSEAQRELDLVSAGNSPVPDIRQRDRDTARNSHYARTERIDDIVAGFEALDRAADTTPISRELARILADDGVEAALAYADSKKPSILKDVHAQRGAEPARRRAMLEPLLSAATLRTAAGKATAARAAYNELLKLEPDWSAALEAYAWFLAGPRIWSEAEYDDGDEAARDDVPAHERGHAIAVRLETLDPKNLSVQHLLIASNYRIGRSFADRGERGDDYKALPYFTRGLEIAESLLAMNPKSENAIRKVARCSQQSGAFYERSAFPDAGEKALLHYNRSLALFDSLLKVQPDSQRAARDVVLILDALAEFESSSNAFGGATKSLPYRTRSMEIMEAFLKANPSSTEVMHDLASRLSLVGRFLAKGRNKSDADKGRDYCKRSLELLESAHKASPDSMEAATAVVVAHTVVATHAIDLGDRDEYTRHRRAIYELLRPFAERDAKFDAKIQKLYEGLKAEFAK